MTKAKQPPYLGIAMMVAGGLFLVFLILQFQGVNRHERNFMNLCEKIASAHGFDRKTMSIHCDWIRREYIGDRAPIRVTSPAKLGARMMPHDKHARVMIAQDPFYFSGLSYCYFSFRKWFSAEKIRPQDLASMAVGFSVLKSELTNYISWADTDAGKACLSGVREKLDLKQSLDLLSEMQDKSALIVLNPVAFVGLAKTHKDIRHAVNITLNHERLHMLYGFCPKLQEWAKKHWEDASEMFKKAMARKHPAYNWSDKEIAVREHLAYAFESDPDLIEAQLGRCVF